MGREPPHRHDRPQPRAEPRARARPTSVALAWSSVLTPEPPHVAVGGRVGQPRLPSFLAQVEATRVALAEIGVVQVGMVASEAVCVEPLRGDRPPGGDPVESVGRADSELQRPLQPVPCVSGSVVCFSRMEQLGVGAQRAAERASDLQEAERRGTLPIRAHYQTVMSCRSPISAPLARSLGGTHERPLPRSSATSAADCSPRSS